MCGKLDRTFAILVLACLGFGKLSSSQNVYNFTCDLSPVKHDRVLQEAISKLKKDGYTVEEGVMEFSTSTLFFANPTTPYGLYKFGNRSPMWRLSEQEAIVFFGCTPPPAKYFSFRSYVFTTFNNLRPTILFASLGDSTNQLVINTTGSNSGDPFGKTTLVTTTADTNTDSAVREAFAAAGLPSTAMNTDIVPSSLVKLGDQPLADTFSMLVRVAVPENPTQNQAYLNTTWPIIRVIPPAQDRPSPFQTPVLRKRGTGSTESSYNSSLLRFVDRINKTIMSQTNGLSSTRDRMNPVPLEGRECIETMTNCLGDNRDAAYRNSSRFYQLGAQDQSFFIVCGLNHVKTGKATYINFAVSSVLAVDDSKFEGSARKFAPNMPNVDMFYAYKVARDCGGEEFCLEVPLSTVRADKDFNFVARAYLEPPTKVGPDNSELLLPYVLYYTTD